MKYTRQYNSNTRDRKEQDETNDSTLATEQNRERKIIDVSEWEIYKVESSWYRTVKWKGISK